MNQIDLKIRNWFDECQVIIFVLLILFVAVLAYQVKRVAKEVPAPVKAAAEETELSRDLKLWDITLLGVGAMIGAGIFVLTGIAAGIAGPGLLLAFLLNGFFAGLTALIYAELGSAVPEAGGGYLWVKSAMGQFQAFQSGWMSWLAHIVAGSLYGLGFGAYFALLLGEFGWINYDPHDPTYFFLIPTGFSDPIGFGYDKLFGVIVIIVFLFINFLGSSETGAVGNIITIIKIFVIGVFIISGLFVAFKSPFVNFEKLEPIFPSSLIDTDLPAAFQNSFIPVIIAMGFTFIAFEGYEIIVQTGEEVENPNINIPKAIFYALMIVVPIYVLVGLVALVAITPASGETTWQFLSGVGELGIAEAELRHIADFIYAGNWIEFGINRWNDFLLYVFGELNKHPSGYYQGKIGLERAKQEAIAFEKEFGRKPYSLDNYSIHTAIRRGYYTEFGISTFHEFLLYVFNEINVKPSGYYEGKSGLRRAKNEALDYFKENNRQPTSNDLTSIMNSIYRKNWKDYGINTWYDFLVYTFGEANFLPPGYYRGKQGLVNASNKVKKFKMEKGKIPITSDFPSINNVITQKEWVRFGIKCWIDFINYIFDENFRPKGDYDGKPGLRKAVEEAKEFERKNGTKPGCRDLPWIFSVISEMKKWIDLEISSWNEFLRYVFGSVKKKKSGYYNGRKGLDRAMKEVIEFIEINRRMPKINDLPSIANGVYRKYWISFDIKNWKGFLLKCKQLK